MGRFWLIQRGRFNNEGDSLTGDNGLINLDYMGSAEFEFNAIPRAFRRIMYHFRKYDVFGTCIHTPEGEELMVFCQKNNSEKIINAIKSYIEKPYHLKEFSELDKIPYAQKDNMSYMGRRSNFWWCIDNVDLYGNWMAFLSSNQDRFIAAITNDYKNWWMKKSKKEREEEYKKSLAPF